MSTIRTRTVTCPIVTELGRANVLYMAPKPGNNSSSGQRVYENIGGFSYYGYPHVNKVTNDIVMTKGEKILSLTTWPYLLPNNPFTSVKTRIGSKLIYLRRYFEDDRWKYQHVIKTSAAFPITAMQNPAWDLYNEVLYPQQDRLIQKAFKQAKHSGFNPTVDLLEFTSTAKYFGQSVERFATIFQKGLRQGLKKESPAGLWLEKHFALDPVLSTIDSTAKDIAQKGLSRHWAHRRGKAKAEAGKTVRKDLPLVDLFSGTQVPNSTWQLEFDIACSCKVFVIYTQTYDLLYAADTPGLDALWATLPFSFVADWVVNVGEVLTAQQPASNGAVFAQAGMSKLVTASRSNGVNPYFLKLNPGYFYDSQEGWYEDFYIYRNRSLLTPSDISWIPSIKNPFDWWKTTTSLALIKQLSKSKR